MSKEFEKLSYLIMLVHSTLLATNDAFSKELFSKGLIKRIYYRTDNKDLESS